MVIQVNGQLEDKCWFHHKLAAKVFDANYNGYSFLGFPFLCVAYFG